MRSRLFITIFLAACILYACQKKFESPENLSLNFDVVFTAKVSGTPFNAAISGAVRRSDGIISIAGKSNDGQQFAFTLKDSGVDVYNLDIRSATNFAGYIASDGIAFSTNEGINIGDSGGSLAITSIDSVNKRFSGTFNFKVYNQDHRLQKIVTEGVFNNIPY